mmetsp:Transcript_37304/g.81676  ORF Transcript_37304/g.81676 Transcript_37304/m.81676 type:complete len:601 (+) Transcript_37304:176-1978(+)
MSLIVSTERTRFRKFSETAMMPSASSEMRSRLLRRSGDGREPRNMKQGTILAESQHHRRNQKDSNDLLLMAAPATSTEATGFDCSDYNPGRNQPEPEPEPEPEPDFGFEDSNEDLDGHIGKDSNDLDMFDLAVLCLSDTSTSTAEGGPTLYLCDDISRAKGQIIPYEYRVYLTKGTDIVEDTGLPMVNGEELASSKAGLADEVSTNDTLRNVEASIVTYVSDKMGLSGCESTNPVPVSRRSLTSNTRRRLAETTTEGDTDKNIKLHPMIGVTSDPSDVVTDCPENSPNLPFRCKYVKGHLAAYFHADTDEATMINYANVIGNHLSVGMEEDAFVNDKAKLLMYVPPSLLSEETPKDDPNTPKVEQPVSPPIPEESQPSSSNMGYIMIGVGCVVASALLLLAVHLHKKRRKNRASSSAVAVAPVTDIHCEEAFQSSEDGGLDTRENFCIEVEVSDTETVAMSVDKDGHVEEVSDENNEIAKKGDSQGTAATEDDCATISTQESGVTLYLDKRVASDVSALTWYGPPQQSDAPTSNLGRGLAALGMGAIQEDVEEEEDELMYDFNTEDDIDASAPKNAPRTVVSMEKDSLCYSSSNGSRRIV